MAKFIRLPAVESRTGMSRSSIYLKMDQGLFPQSVKLGKRSVGWLESEVEDWIERRVEQSRQPA